MAAPTVGLLMATKTSLCQQPHYFVQPVLVLYMELIFTLTKQIYRVILYQLLTSSRSSTLGGTKTLGGRCIKTPALIKKTAKSLLTQNTNKEEHGKHSSKSGTIRWYQETHRAIHHHRRRFWRPICSIDERCVR